jgi:hypothetical protein
LNRILIYLKFGLVHPLFFVSAIMKSFALTLGLVSAAVAAPLEERAPKWSGWKGVKNLFVLFVNCISKDPPIY